MILARTRLPPPIISTTSTTILLIGDDMADATDVAGVEERLAVINVYYLSAAPK